MGLMAAFRFAFHSLLVVSLFSKGAESCMRGWKFYKGHCYGLFNDKLSWSDAEIECHKKGSHLASIHYMEEMVFLSQYIIRYLRGDENVWIGLHASKTTKNWEYVDHTSVRYLPWNDGEPNNRWSNEMCVELSMKKDYIRWNDKKCSVTQPYLCKMAGI